MYPNANSSTNANNAEVHPQKCGYILPKSLLASSSRRASCPPRPYIGAHATRSIEQLKRSMKLAKLMV